MISFEGKSKKIGLALSGGGYRAAAFHIGTFKKLKEIDILDNVDIISTVSGGSIAGAYYLLNKDDFGNFESSLIKKLQKSVKRRIIWSIQLWLPILIQIIIIGFIIWNPFNLSIASWIKYSFGLIIFPTTILFQFKIFQLTKSKIKAYNKLFFENKNISDFPDNPKIAINATNLETGTLWTFSKQKISDSSYEFPKDKSQSITFDGKGFPIASAVACSTCVPFPFNPIKIEKKYYSDPSDYGKIDPYLIDGGIYDNQGIHKLAENKSSYSCDVIIVSDGSYPFKLKYRKFNSVGILRRASDVMMRKIKSLQFIREVYSIEREIAYFSLDWNYGNCVTGFVSNLYKGNISKEIIDFHSIPSNYQEKNFNEIHTHVCNKINYNAITENCLTPKELEYISNIKTDLAALNLKQIELLSKHSAILTHLQIALYCPSLNFKK